MIKSTLKKEIVCDPEKLWIVITDLTDYHWRSDLSKIQVIDSTHFIEFTSSGYPTYFTITKKEYLKKYQFELENTNMKGTWEGTFHLLPSGKLEITFEESVEVFHPLMRFLAKPYLRKQQNRYWKDLEKKLNLK